VVAGRPVEVVDLEIVEVRVDVDRVLAVTEEVGVGRVPAGPEPAAPLTLPAGGGRTSR
jgi:hypothetical protein